MHKDWLLAIVTETQTQLLVLVTYEEHSVILHALSLQSEVSVADLVLWASLYPVLFEASPLKGKCTRNEETAQELKMCGPLFFILRSFLCQESMAYWKSVQWSLQVPNGRQT